MAIGTNRRLIEPGSPDNLGASCEAAGVNFAVFSPDADRVELCLFDDADRETLRIDLPGQSSGIWHGFVPRLSAGQRYGFRAHGRFDPPSGLRFNPHKLLLDPYARAIAGRLVWTDAVFDYQRANVTGGLRASTQDSAPFVPKGVVTAAGSPPMMHRRIPWTDTLIYEINVRGYTKLNLKVLSDDRGKFAGLRSPAILEHLRSLGVSSVELMPIHAAVDEEFLAARGLGNYWGYNTLGFFAPDPRFLRTPDIGEFRQMVNTFHESGFEVILDVVYNHTAEGGRLGPSLSFRGLANAAYYRLQAGDSGEYVDDTGCGNTINVDQPIVRRLIVDSLLYWAAEMGVDGFRFDLATILGRRSDDGFDREHELFAEIRKDPALRNVKLIAEPWDLGPGGYQLGGFPTGWAEWNDRFRDTVRRFWRRDAMLAPELAKRVHGSSDIFEASGRGPGASVNFVTSHDGFTMADLVSYAVKHNEANAEGNRDGHEHNYSTNYGSEGPSDDPAVLAARRRHRLNLLATLLFSQGTPMLLGGDEFGNTQAGNNNAYAQDNETGWVDWSGLEEDRAFFEEVRAIVRLRRELPLLRQENYRHGDVASATGRPDIEWFNPSGRTIAESEWPDIAALGMLLSATEPPRHGAVECKAVAVLFNAAEVPCTFSLPEIGVDGAWRCRYITDSRESTICADRLRLPGGSIACLSFGR